MLYNCFYAIYKEETITIITTYIFMAPSSSLSAQSSLTIKILNHKNTIIFEDLKSGPYAIRYFHDENKNNELDTNIPGILKEGFGFSDDAIGNFY